VTLRYGPQKGPITVTDLERGFWFVAFWCVAFGSWPLFDSGSWPIG
jgi:hypothetical protein